MTEKFFNMLWGNKIDTNWISVKDRAPEKNGSYLCFCNTCQNINILQWLDGQWLFASAIVVDDVTHWMQLPANPNDIRKKLYNENKKITLTMDMPSNCYECPMCYETEGCYSDVCQLYFYLSNENEDFDAEIYNYKDDIPKWCPLLKFEKVEV